MSTLVKVPVINETFGLTKQDSNIADMDIGITIGERKRFSIVSETEIVLLRQAIS